MYTKLKSRRNKQVKFVRMWRVCFYFLLMTISPQAHARTLTESQKSDARRVIETIRRCRHIPGMTLSVVTNDTVIWNAGFGLSDLERNKSVTTDTLFPIASTTKAFTTTLLAMLMEKHGNRYVVQMTFTQVSLSLVFFY